MKPLALLLSGSRFRAIVAILAQQAAEKYVKAFLTHHQIELPKTHMLKELLELEATADPGLAERLKPSDHLTQFTVETRNPTGPEPETMDEARQTIWLAERVRDEIRAALGM